MDFAVSSSFKEIKFFSFLRGLYIFSKYFYNLLII